MPDWQERITRETEPAIRAEHDLRYHAALPAVRGAATWCDLGCGNGVAQAEALGGPYGGRLVLVDVAKEAVDRAAKALPAADRQTLVADLTNDGDLVRVREALLAGPAPRVVTCFEVVEHLETFVPLVRLLRDLPDTTVVLSVPNDRFWALENPHHLTVWGEGSFEELAGLLPGDRVLLRQVAIQGSALVPADAEAADEQATVRIDPAGVPTHLLAAFGPAAAELARPQVRLAQADLDAQRRWERQREADNAYFQAVIARHSEEQEAWRSYIHDLERRLGLPLSGSQA